MVKKLKKSIFLLVLIGCGLTPGAAHAICSENSSCGAGDTSTVQSAVVCPAGEIHPAGDNTTCSPTKNAIDCASGKIDANDPTKCAPLGNDCNGNSNDTCLKNNPITKNLNNAVDFLSAGVGIVVIAVIIIGGIQYTLAGDNATAIQAARQRIINGLIALFAFLFTFAFLQWLIPGGL